MERARICIYGAGAMGTSLGVALWEAGTRADFVTRNAAHVDRLKARGYSALLPEEMTGEYDVVFLATKQRENPAIARFLLPFLKEEGALVTVQNGLPEEGLARAFGADRVYGCALGWGAELVAPGEVSISSKEERLRLSIGAFGAGRRLGELSELLSSAFICETGNLSEIRYGKLVVNASFSTLSAISGLTFGELAKKHGRTALRLARETVAVAQSCGCKRLVQNGRDLLKFFKNPFARFLLPVAMKKHAAIRSGMLKDLENGRRCDVDFVAGAAVEAGRERGVKTPWLARATALVHEIENGFAEIAPETLRLLEEINENDKETTL